MICFFIFFLLQMAIKTDHPPTIYRHLPNQALHLLHLKGTEVDQLDHC